MQETSNSNASKNDQINLREVLIQSVNQWKLFLFCITIALISAFVYLQFATYEYQVSSTILINDENNDGGSTSEISVFEDLGLFEGPKTSLDTEIGVLKSKTLIERVVKELKLNITYHAESGFTTKELYENERPFKINIFADDSNLNQLDTIFSISAKSATEFDLFDSNDKLVSEGSFGEKVTCQFGDLVVTPITIGKVKIGQKILINIDQLEDISIDLKKRIEVFPDNLNSNLLILKLQDPIRSKAKDILDNLVVYYNKDAIEYKSEVAKNTNLFLSSRIDDISVELKSLDQGVQSYKTRNNLSNLDSQASIVLATNAELTKRIVDLTSEIKLIDYVTEYMNTNTDDLIPANLGLLNENTSQNTINYNNLILERNRLSTSANSENPVIENLNSQIASLRASIDRSLINTRSSLKISLNDAKLQEISLTSKISANPRKEREIRDIERQQEIYETLYLYLLQKREENSISLAVTSPNAKIIDKAFGSRSPVAPRRLIILLGSLLLGGLVPISLITIKSILDNKIHTLEDLEDLIEAPSIGNIPTIKSNTHFITFNNEKFSNIAESFRLLRTNVDHLLFSIKNNNTEAIESSNTFEKETEVEKIMFEPTFDKTKAGTSKARTEQISPKKGKIIFITSTIKNEGKTFIAINLASAFALLDKKVLLIEANLRNPKISDYLKREKQKGLTHFLTGDHIEIGDIITNHEKTNLDIIGAGSIPSNPSELLANGRFKELLAKSKKNYDYIIIDTSAVNIATDTLLLSQYADLFLFVVRANFLGKKMLDIPEKLYKNNRLPNMALLINGTNYKKRGYDREYNFGDKESKKHWLKRALNRA
jgi:capsular exopolysaccharide synthesis family protein